MTVDKKVLDKKVVDNIRRYVADNDISIQKLAKESNIPYHRLWTIINQNRKITVGDYDAICKAVFEPLDYFIPE